MAALVVISHSFRVGHYHPCVCVQVNSVGRRVSKIQDYRDAITGSGRETRPSHSADVIELI